MTEAELRKKYIDCAKSYYGAVRGDKRHKAIVDAYNSFQPHPRGWKLTYTDNWCAAFVSAVAILCCMTGIIPVECSCGEQVKVWQSWGRWIEDDKHRPKIGELLYYYWKDGKNYATTDQTGAPNHVGIVTWASGDKFIVIEGNKGNSSVVGYREMAINGQYIRGYASPDFASLERAETCAVTLPVLARGSKGEAVKAMQALLNLHGEALDVDGSFGPATQAAVHRAQSRANIYISGIADCETWSSLIAP